MEVRLPLETDRLLIRPLGAGRNGWEVVERASGRIVGDAALSSGPELVLRVTEAYELEAGSAILRATFDAGITRISARPGTAGGASRTLELLGFHRQGADGVYVCLQPGVSAADVHEVLDALDGLRLWLDGGWGVDALLGRQTRPHRDLDFALDERDLASVESRLRELGYEEVEEGWVGRPTRVAFTDGRGRWLDVHPLRFDDAGDGWQTLPDGGLGAYPGSELGSGTVAGRGVPCISAALQVRHHRGYTLAAHDRADLALLEETLEVHR